MAQEFLVRFRLHDNAAPKSDHTTPDLYGTLIEHLTDAVFEQKPESLKWLEGNVMNVDIASSTNVLDDPSE